MDLYETVIALFCDPEGNPCMAGSDGDREVLAAALMEHRKALRPSDAPADVEKIRQIAVEWMLSNANHMDLEEVGIGIVNYLASRNLIRTEPTDGGE